ncbi:hypothetical protein BKA70DRAFT_1414084 [Coprinopsis sp. MPI-PUGE-AT-0042]|nr:hypothetical protein BKA70DRAFT_1414084 [Coprinopsis sp. MPI-PUGE-AT-0042]
MACPPNSPTHALRSPKLQSAQSLDIPARVPRPEEAVVGPRHREGDEPGCVIESIQVARRRGCLLNLNIRCPRQESPTPLPWSSTPPSSASVNDPASTAEPTVDCPMPSSEKPSTPTSWTCIRPSQAPSNIVFWWTTANTPATSSSSATSPRHGEPSFYTTHERSGLVYTLSLGWLTGQAHSQPIAWTWRLIGVAEVNATATDRSACILDAFAAQSTRSRRIAPRPSPFSSGGEWRDQDRGRVGTGEAFGGPRDKVTLMCARLSNSRGHLLLSRRVAPIITDVPSLPTLTIGDIRPCSSDDLTFGNADEPLGEDFSSSERCRGVVAGVMMDMDAGGTIGQVQVAVIYRLGLCDWDWDARYLERMACTEHRLSQCLEGLRGGSAGDEGYNTVFLTGKRFREERVPFTKLNPPTSTALSVAETGYPRLLLEQSLRNTHLLTNREAAVDQVGASEPDGAAGRVNASNMWLQSLRKWHRIPLRRLTL